MMNDDLGSAAEAKLQRESSEERQLIAVVHRALGEDLLRIRRFLEAALTHLEAEEADAARITVLDPSEIEARAKAR